MLFDFVPPHAFDFDQELPQNVAQIILYSHVTIQFLPWIDLLHTFDFRIYFGKTVVASNFDEKLTLSIAQISGYDLGNRRMLCKQKYWIKNMVVKILV